MFPSSAVKSSARGILLAKCEWPYQLAQRTPNLRDEDRSTAEQSLLLLEAYFRAEHVRGGGSRLERSQFVFAMKSVGVNRKVLETTTSLKHRAMLNTFCASEDCCLAASLVDHVPCRDLRRAKHLVLRTAPQ